MIAAWMAASTALAVLLGAAALAAERAFRTTGREARGVWVAALGCAIGWPALAPAAAALFGRAASAVPAPAGIRDGSTVTITSALPVMPAAWVAKADVALIALWACASIVLLARLVLAMRVLARVECTADHDIIEGVPVLVTPTLGPAVFGTRRPRVLIPRWLLDLDAPLRALVVRHEQEHCRVRDPQLTLAVAFAIALTPWNLGVWWIARRLRLAVEVDCDVRVLRHAGDPERYSRLLLFIAQRQSHMRLAPMLAESNSHLSRRIDAMNAPRPVNPRMRMTAFALLAVLALAASTKFAKELTAAPTIAPRKVQPAAPAANRPAPALANDHPVMALPGSPQPRYPDILKTAGVEGGILVAFVVDADGTVDTTTLKIIHSTHGLFRDALIAALPAMRFLPAEVNGQAVRELVQEPFVFTIAGSVLSSPEGQRATLERLLSATGPSEILTIPAVFITAAPPAAP
jgi:TonB family protein